MVENKGRIHNILSRLFTLKKAMIAIDRDPHTRTLESGKIVPVAGTTYTMQSNKKEEETPYPRGSKVTIIANSEYMSPSAIIDSTVERLFLEEKDKIREKLLADAASQGIPKDRHEEYVKSRLDDAFLKFKADTFKKVNDSLHAKRDAKEEQIKQGLGSLATPLEVKRELDQAMFGERAAEFSKIFKQKVEGLKIRGIIKQYHPDIDKCLIYTEHGDFLVPTAYIAMKKRGNDDITAGLFHGSAIQGENIYETPEKILKKNALIRAKREREAKRHAEIQEYVNQRMTPEQRLIYEHIPYAEKMSSYFFKKYSNRMQGALTPDELRSDALIGLVEAAQTFKGDNDSKFTTWAYWSINNRIRSTIEQTLNLMQAPHDVRERWARYHQDLEKESFLPVSKVNEIEGVSKEYAKEATEKELRNKEVGIPAKVDEVLVQQAITYANTFADKETSEMPPGLDRKKLRNSLLQSGFDKFMTGAREAERTKIREKLSKKVFARHYKESRQKLIDAAFNQAAAEDPELKSMTLENPTISRQAEGQEETSGDIERSRMINGYVALAIEQRNDELNKELTGILTPHEHAALTLKHYGFEPAEIGLFLKHVEQTHGSLPDTLRNHGSTDVSYVKRVMQDPKKYYFEKQFERLLNVYGKNANPDSALRLMTDRQRVIYEHRHDPVTGQRRTVREIAAAIKESTGSNDNYGVTTVSKENNRIDALMAEHGGSGEKIFGVGEPEAVGQHFLDRAMVKVVENIPRLKTVWDESRKLEA